MPLNSRAIAWLALSWLAVSTPACAEGLARGPQRYDRGQLAQTLAEPEGVELEVGVFPLKKGAIVDGDTIKVAGLDASLRLFALDTEETFKSEKNKRQYEEGWEVYLKKKKAETSRPVKIATPLGEDAKHFAKDWFKGVQRVRLERDHPKEIRGRFNRYLVYVFGEKGGEWVNYNVECVRAGMSPYFTKYGYSRRFHDEFEAAQREARDAQRGIWEPGTEHYDDYQLRLDWWNARAEYIERFAQESEGREDMIALTEWDAQRRLDALVDREVEVLATVSSIRMREGKAPTRVMLSRRMFEDMPVIFWDDEIFKASHIGDFKGEFVRVRGLVTKYKNKYNGREVLQIEVRLPAQVQIPPYVPPGKDPSVLDREVDRTIAPRVESPPAESAPTPLPASTETDPVTPVPEASPVEVEPDTNEVSPAIPEAPAQDASNPGHSPGSDLPAPPTRP